MKKVLSILLSIVMLFSVGIMGVNAQEEENLCQKFENQLGDFYLRFLEDETMPYSAGVIAWRTWLLFPNSEDYFIGDESDNRDDFPDYRFPAEEFEAFANKLFKVEVDLKTANYSFIDNISYNAETGTYDLLLGAGGGGDDGRYYAVEGYVKNADNTYDVYMYMVIPDIMQDSLEYYFEELGTTREELGDKLQSEEIDDIIYYTISRAKNVKMTVSYDGEYVKIISHEKLNDIPPVEGMITPEPETPQIDYDTPEGVEIEGDTAFEEGTVVKVENVASGEIYERAEKSLNEIAENGKIAVFEFSATKDNAEVQPNGKVKVSFNLPANLSADNLKMFYVATDGKTEEIAITVDKENKTVSAELEHFSTYVLCNVKTTTPTTNNSTTNNDAENTSPQTGDTSNLVLFVVLLFVSASVLTVLAISKKKADNSNH